LPLNDPNSTPGNGVIIEDDYAEATITVTGANLPTIAKEFSPGLSKPNTPTRMTLKIWNNETTPITLTAALIDTLPSTPAQMVIAATPALVTTIAGVIATAGGSSITIPNGTVLKPGLNQIQLDVTVPINGYYCDSISAGSLKTTSCNNLETTLACLQANSTFTLAPIIKKSFAPTTVQTNANSTLTITIENRNAGALTLNQDFSDYLPHGLLVASAATTTCGGTISVPVGDSIVSLVAGSTIAAGTCTITVPVKSATAGTYCNSILMNALLTTLGTDTNLGNEDVAEACLTVTATPCIPLSSLTITPTPAGTIAPNGTVSLAATGTGTGASTLYTWAAGSGTFNPQSTTTTYTAPASAGTYQVTVTASNQLTGYGTCTATATIDITVAAPTCDVTATVLATQATCTALVPNSDGKIEITAHSGGGTKVGYSIGADYTGPDFATATTLTAAPYGVATGLPNPSVNQPYTVRVYQNATCFKDYTVLLPYKQCTMSNLCITAATTPQTANKGEIVTYTQFGS
jgi:PKD domain